MASEKLMSIPSAEPTAAGDDRVFGATVRAVAVPGGPIAVEHEGGHGVARRAASCLLAPRSGDRVLCAEVGDSLYVLAVLEREGSATEIEVDGDLSLRSRGGSVRLAGRAVALVGEEISSVAKELRLLGDMVTIDAKRVRQVSEYAERIADSVKETFGSSYRSVAEGEHVQAGNMTWSLRHMLRCHAETAVVTAKKLIKLDGDQIHLG